ncbi:hypothetical protein B0H17DRAFT_1124617 [Mycena rosella]|uniref:Uncharacterized protein n=1 Tax=Mycena rosella TaxID=1033263 RepID=A0AAD7GZH2_MYCRO|nr:hypothetical protein B0H17DRAFT_1124617 [Mycena rosella]
MDSGPESHAPWSGDTYSRPVGDIPDPIPLTESAAALEKLQRTQKSRLRRGLVGAEGNVAADEAEDMLHQLDTWLANLRTINDPVERRRHQVLWGACLLHLGKNNPIPEDCHWDVDVVKAWAPRYIPWLFRHTDALPGRKSLKAGTIARWNRSLIENIALFTRDPEDSNRRAGTMLLTRGGLFKKLRRVVHNLIQDEKLDRNLNPKLFYGRAEVQLFMQEILAAPASHCRTGVQIIVRTLFSFFLALRPSSLAPRTAALAALDRFMTLGHIRMFRLPGVFALRSNLHIDQLKGALDTVQSMELLFTLDSVQLTSNILFDLNVWLLFYLFLRGTLEIKSWDALLSTAPNQEAEILIKPSMKHLPLANGNRFVQMKDGEYTNKVITAHSVSTTFAYWARKAGLPGGGAGTLRRDTGNTFSLQMGAQLAQDLLNHMIKGCFHRHYSCNVGNFDLTGLRLAEVAGGLEAFPGQALKETLGKHVYLNCAVEAMVRKARKAQENGMLATKRTAHPDLTPAEAQQARDAADVCLLSYALAQLIHFSYPFFFLTKPRAGPAVVTAVEKYNEVVNRLFSHLTYHPTAPFVPSNSRRRTLETRFVHDRALGTKLLAAAEDPDDPIAFKITPTPVQTQTFAAMAVAIRSAGTDVVHAQSRTRKYFKDRLQRQYTRNLAASSATGTVEERASAEATVRDPGQLKDGAWEFNSAHIDKSRKDTSQADQKADAQQADAAVRDPSQLNKDPLDFTSADSDRAFVTELDVVFERSMSQETLENLYCKHSGRRHEHKDQVHYFGILLKTKAMWIDQRRWLKGLAGRNGQLLK